MIIGSRRLIMKEIKEEVNALKNEFNSFKGELNDFKIIFVERGKNHEENKRLHNEMNMRIFAMENESKERNLLWQSSALDIKAIKETLADGRATKRWLISMCIQFLSPLITICGALIVLGKILGKI